MDYTSVCGQMGLSEGAGGGARKPPLKQCQVPHLAASSVWMKPELLKRGSRQLLLVSGSCQPDLCRPSLPPSLPRLLHSLTLSLSVSHLLSRSLSLFAICRGDAAAWEQVALNRVEQPKCFLLYLQSELSSLSVILGHSASLCRSDWSIQSDKCFNTSLLIKGLRTIFSSSMGWKKNMDSQFAIFTIWYDMMDQTRYLDLMRSWYMLSSNHIGAVH